MFFPREGYDLATPTELVQNQKIKFISSPLSINGENREGEVQCLDEGCLEFVVCHLEFIHRSFANCNLQTIPFPRR